MSESAEFLATLNHENPERPRFAIQRGAYPVLSICFQGQQMLVPMAEVLLFARRWEADWKLRFKAAQEAGHLSVFPYPLMNAGLTDPDFDGLQWRPDELDQREG